MSGPMTQYLASALVGTMLIVVVESGIWMNACLGLSLKHEDAEFTELMRHAPYRVLWLPKTVFGVIEIGLFWFAARYYRSGGEDITLAIVFFIGLFIFGGLVFLESVRAIKCYERP
jgi:hypothetical protein